MRAKPPSKLRLYWLVLKGCYTQISESNLALIAAGVAFYAMLSVFPALAALIALLSLISDPNVVIAQLEDAKGLMPEDVYEIINTQIVGLVTTRSDKLSWAGIFSVLIAIWTARVGVGAMMTGLNSVYNEKNHSAAWHYVRAYFLTIALVGVGIVALLTVVVAPILLAFFPVGGFGYLLAEVLRWVIAVSVLFVGIGLLYRYGPNRSTAKVAWLTPGAAFAVVSWAVLSIGFSYYVSNFGNYNQVYGSIGAVIAMLVWLWISSFLILIGASLNAQIELWIKPDTTVDAPKPMGENGA